MESIQDRSRRDQRSSIRLERFQKRARLIDRLMGWLIPVGGLGVLVSLFGIFIFILFHALPLFRKAEVTPLNTCETGIRDALLLGADEQAGYAFVLGRKGELVLLGLSGENRPESEAVPLPGGTSIHSAHYDQRSQMITLGLSDGSILEGYLLYPSSQAGELRNEENIRVRWEDPVPLSDSPAPVVALDAYFGETHKATAGVQQVAVERNHIHILSQRKQRSLFGETAYEKETASSILIEDTAQPVQVLLGTSANTLVVRMSNDALKIFFRDPAGWRLAQQLQPFAESGSPIASLDFVQGRLSLSITSAAGEHVVYSLTRIPETGLRQFLRTKAFPSMDAGAVATASSLRNKALLLATPETLSLRYMTTEAVRWEEQLDTPFQAVLLGSRYSRILGLDTEGRLHAFALDDPHPEAGLKAFFGKIWYEGQDRPRHLWQSSGGTDTFEPKLSLIPLLFGSFKGTVYALLFAIPIAIMGAVYTSQFLHPRAKQVIKPMIEIMASLPSVVLGFIAALWLAPLVEDRVPSVLLSALFIPASALLAGYGWRRLPLRLRLKLTEGSEFLILLPVMAASIVLAWHLGPLFEQVAFRYTDPATGQTFADFRIWWESWNGGQFQQRNAMVVGFIMGFAVIPIIFSIAEDALSSVPRSLVSGSLALGASRWQTTARIVVPSAAAGILSAVMIGLGRAVGETMIVVMATGNTPILDLDLFSGMRTLSATIAVELPEAPQGGTLYRALFLGSLVLFILTFAINTVAEILRGRIRNRFRVIAT